jgi:pyruvate ferredoxin oxidoreductase delta subunit
MNRPSITKYKTPEHISGYPIGPCYQAGHLVTENAGWRTEKPILDKEKCTGCFYCYLCCPEGVIFKLDGKIEIDYSFCKGCGICARVCKSEAIVMIREAKDGADGC